MKQQRTAAEVAVARLRYLTPSEVDDLTSRSEEMRYAAGDVLIAEGSPPLGLFLIMDGAVRVTKNVAGHSVLVDELGNGEMVGEVSLVLRSETSATVSAVTEVTGVWISCACVSTLTVAQPRLGVNLYRSIAATLAGRLASTTEKAAALTPPVAVATVDPALVAAARNSARDRAARARARAGLVDAAEPASMEHPAPSVSVPLPLS